MGTWEINGRVVNPLYRLMEKAECLEDYLATLPANHPDRPEWVEKVNETYGVFLETRRCALN